MVRIKCTCVLVGEDEMFFVNTTISESGIGTNNGTGSGSNPHVRSNSAERAAFGIPV